MRYHHALCVSLVLWALGSTLQAKPAPPIKPAPKVEPAATLIICGPTNWGEFAQFDRQVTITGNTSWTFAGEIRPDGRVQGIWTCGTTIAYAVYVIQPDGRLVGHYGYDGQAVILGNGNLLGTIQSETIEATKVEPGPIQ